jgi:hypothetical protein
MRIHENSPYAAIAARVLGTKAVAMVLGRSIHLHGATRAQFLADRLWVRHELVHILQFRRLGFLRFILLYAWWSLIYGYENNPLEREVRELSSLRNRPQPKA